MKTVQTFFTSDPHFHHKKIVEFTERGKDTTQSDHDEWLIAVWNSQVNPWDKVYMLGDFSFSHKYQDIYSIASQLNGQKFFLCGNHDDPSIFDRLKTDGLIQEWYDAKHIKLGQDSVHLYHFPVEAWNKQGYGAWHLHGHSHGNLKTQHIGKRIDVGLDSAYKLLGSHRFFSEEDIRNIMATRKISVSDHHKERQ